MRKSLEKALDWSLGSVVGNVAWVGLAGLGAWLFNERTGLLASVVEFAGEHAQGFAAWTASAALVGAVVGLLIRHRIALGQLAKKDAEIASLEGQLQMAKMPGAVGGSQREKPVPSAAGIAKLDPIMARAVWRAFEGGDMPIGEAHEEVWRSMLEEDGIFERVCSPYMGARNPTDRYRLTPAWRLLLMEPGNLNRVKVAAGA